MTEQLCHTKLPSVDNTYHRKICETMLFFQTHFHYIVIDSIEIENDEEYSIFNPASKTSIK